MKNIIANLNRLKSVLQNITGNFNWLDGNAYRRLIPALTIALFALSLLSAVPAEAG